MACAICGSNDYRCRKCDMCGIDVGACHSFDCNHWVKDDRCDVCWCPTCVKKSNKYTVTITSGPFAGSFDWKRFCNFHKPKL